VATRRTGADKLLGALLQDGPPEALKEEVLGPLDPWKAGPYEYIGSQGQGIRGAGAGTGLILVGGLHSLLYLPDEDGNPAGSMENEFGPCGQLISLRKLT